LHVRRVKNGKPMPHPIRGDELRALRELHRQYPESGYVFTTERGGPFAPDAVNRLVKRIGERAGLPFPVHVHMLRQPAATRWRMPAMTRAVCKIGSATARSSIRSGTPSYPRLALRIFGGAIALA
jgi:hypothetical protein